MPDPTPAPVAEKVTEAPVKSTRETLEDTLVGDSEPTEKAPVEPAGESTDEVDKIVEGIEPGEEPGEAPEEVDEAEEILRESPKSEEDKAKVQIRIDKLTAERNALKEENAALKAQKESKDGKVEYSDAQLKTALKKAMEEGDSDLVWDIMQYQQKKAKEELVKMYENEKKQGSEAVERVKGEWLDIKSQHAKYVDPKMPEIFPGSREALNLDNEQSLLYRVANKLYWSEDEGKAKYYRGQPGGQKLAVSDALAHILARYMSKGGKTKKIERQLLKEKRKKTIVGEGSMETEEKPSKPVSDGAILDEVLSERRKYQNERGR